MSKSDLKPAKKGEIRNPNGRGKGHLNVKTRMLKLFKTVVEQQNPLTGKDEKFTVDEMLDMALVGKALSGDVPAYREIMDRVEGKIVTPIEVDGLNNETDIVLNINPFKSMPVELRGLQYQLHRVRTGGH